ncbi:thermonuclease family protein [Campylobacter sp. CN_NA1]|uniref:thermonuclease family protein n=1 Tax=Campylobacter sp. CN_NA1 TaxID=2984150 RepID=UPI0022E9E09C|nr:thermonuclease family protein [Campylobacter sp. CN_NA1]MDA3056455.1 thermonuclease family protein [Campylobacter sp. CN_NA1]
MRLFLFLFLSIFAFADTQIVGKVVKVYDGDTIHILDDDLNRFIIRFYGIDAPEIKQPFGKKSREFLAKKISGKRVKIQIKNKDKYRRILGIVTYRKKDINAEMVKNGYAWSYDKFSKKYKKLERVAKREKVGLWADKHKIRPEKFRYLIGVKPYK